MQMRTHDGKRASRLDVTTRSRMKSSRAIKRRDKALHEMPKPIEMIAMPAEKRFDPVEERHARVGVMPADAEQHDVESNQRVARAW